MLKLNYEVLEYIKKRIHIVLYKTKKGVLVILIIVD